MGDVALTWLSFTAWLILTALLFIILARWSAGEGEWGSLTGLVRGFHDWATGSRPPTGSSSSPSQTADRTRPDASPRAEMEEL